MHRIMMFVFAVSTMLGGGFVSPPKAQADYPYYGTTYVRAPAVGYTARRGGLFGQRVVVRPVLGTVPVPVPTAPVVVARPVVAAPVVAVPPVAAARPVVSTYYAPPVGPIGVTVPVYRVPVTAVVPVVGF